MSSLLSTLRAVGRTRKSGLRRGSALILAFFLAISMSVVGGLIRPAPAQAATETDCNFADPDTGTYASTLCWFNLSGFDPAQAADGQEMQVSIPGGYTMNFTLTATGGPVYADDFPTYSGAFLGNGGFYAGVGGQPALYQSQDGATSDVVLDDISLVNAAGQQVGGYALIGADAESTDVTESISWQSTSPIVSLVQNDDDDGLGNACGAGFTGIGTREVTCTGSGSSVKTGTAIVGSRSPTEFSQRMVGGGLQAVAFGVLVSSVELTKQVQNRFDDDSFDLSITRGDETVATASTGGTAASATTGQRTVVVGGAGSEFTLSEQADPGDLDLYNVSWSCTRNGEEDPALPTGDDVGSSADVHLGIGDDVSCTITNTGHPRSISLQKRADEPRDVNDDGITDSGDEIDYSFVVTNIGQTDVGDIAIDDSLIPGVTCPDVVLQPGEQTTCTPDQPYRITEADENLREVSNIATANGTVPGTDTDVRSDPSETVTPVEQVNPHLLLVKSADPDSEDSYRVGQQIAYTFTATNTGNVPVEDVAITDTQFSGSGDLSDLQCADDDDLEPGDQFSCTATYELTQADIDAGAVTNTATARGTGPNGNDVTSNEEDARVPVIPDPQVILLKTVDPHLAGGPGETVTYTFRVLNVGNVTLTDPTIDETSFSGSGTVPEADCPDGPLEPGELTTCTSEYTLTQDDVTQGRVTNTATVTATPPTGPTVASDPSRAILFAPPQPDISIDKSADPTDVEQAGDTVDYAFTVTNTGNVSLRDVTVNEVDFSGTGELAEISCPDDTLAAGADMTCTSEYTVTQDDIDTGLITNSASVSGTPPGEDAEPITSPIDDATVTAEQSPAIGLVKSASPSSYDEPGDVINYTFAVTNTGNVSLSNQDIEETAFSGSGDLADASCPAGVFAPGESVECVADYTVTQADIDRGSVRNTATATADPPYRTDRPTSDPDSVVVPAELNPSLTLRKSVDPITVDQAGDEVTYTFKITNTGNVTLHDVGVDENAFSGSGTAPAAVCPDDAKTLHPGDQVSCTAGYTVTQDDVDAGQILNTAVAEGTPPTTERPIHSDPSNAEITAARHPQLALDKSADQLTVDGVGQQLTYSFAVTNTGNVTLNKITIEDTQFSGSGTLSDPTCPDTKLAPGEQTTCTATYQVTEDDLDAGKIINTALAHGTPPGGGDRVSSNPDSVAVLHASEPGIALEATASTDTVDSAGQVITYTVTVANIGNTALTKVDVVEGLFTGHGDLGTLECPPVDRLPIGAELTCTVRYTVMAADLTGDPLQNTAEVTATDPTDNPVGGHGSASVNTVRPSGQHPAPSSPLGSTDSLSSTGAPYGLGFVVSGCLAALAGLGLLFGGRGRR
ncbi:MAG TPA: hypothetical protein VIP98_12285 [Microlunatus sp.]